MQVSSKFLQWFRRRCDDGENQSWLAADIFVDGAGTIFWRAQLDQGWGWRWGCGGGNNSDKFRKNPTSGLGGDVITRKKFTDVWTDRRMAGRTADGLSMG